MGQNFVEGEAAREWLLEASHQRAWRDLQDKCAWSSCFQSPEYVLSWFEIYGAGYTPIVIYEEVGEGDLAGLLVVARDVASGTICPPGDHQAEYPAWLARPEHSAAFLGAAVELLQARCALKMLRFRYLPPGFPSAELFEDARIRHHVFCRTHARPVMDITSADNIEASLRKKSNRSKLNRLKRHGAVRVQIIKTRAELEETIDKISAIYDLRQSDLNDTAPFGEDPLKRAFHLKLMAAGLLHVAILWVGDSLAAALLSVVDDRALVVGVFAMNPQWEAHSPGKLLLLMLGRELAAGNMQEIDLTPGGRWKNRFADKADEVCELLVFASRGEARRYRARQTALRLIKSVLSRVGLTPDKLRRLARLPRQFRI